MPASRACCSGLVLEVIEQVDDGRFAFGIPVQASMWPGSSCPKILPNPVPDGWKLTGWP